MRKSKEERKRDKIKKLKKKVRLVAINETTFEELWSVRLSGFNAIGVLLTFGIIIFFISYLILAYTGMNKILPYNSNIAHDIQLLELKQSNDSLANMMKRQEAYLYGVRKWLSGDTTQAITNYQEDSVMDFNLAETDLQADQEFRSMYYESIDSSMQSTYGRWMMEKQVFQEHLTKPVNGVISDSFNLALNHFGVDIVGAPKSPIKAVDEAYVSDIYWSPDDGNVIILQHNNNAISIYKHLSYILKKKGDAVDQGDAIALIGNTGANSNGIHLHFEYWKQGKAIDPLTLFNF